MGLLACTRHKARRWLLARLHLRVSLKFLSAFLMVVITGLLLLNNMPKLLSSGRLAGVDQWAVSLTDRAVRWTAQDGPDIGQGCAKGKGYLRQLNSYGENLFQPHRKLNLSDMQTCTHPQLDPCDPHVMTFDRSVEKVNCSEDADWVYVDNGIFRISPEATRKYGEVVCEYAPLVRESDFTVRHAEHVKPMLDGTPIPTDFFKVACISAAGKRYHSIHAGLAYQRPIHERLAAAKLPQTALGYDVLMFGFDSVSRMSWYRNLLHTRDYFVNTLGGMELEGYNILGDGTVQALLPILTGNMEADLPNVRKGEAGSTTLDEFPWIWNDFRDAGYVTAWGEDMGWIGTFQMRLNGFKQQPTDHSMRTYFLMAENMNKRYKPWCVRATPRHQRFMNWFTDVYKMYQGKRKFMFGFHSEMSHTDNNLLKSIDEDLSKFLEHLQSSGYLDRTILILMSDHGSRFSEVRKSPQGKFEERMPYFGFRFPPDFRRQHPDVIKNFNINRQRLTTAYDIHETFHDILNFTGAGVGSLASRGISLFKEIPAERSCHDAGIEPHWCACLSWQKVEAAAYSPASAAVIDYINSLTSHVRTLCSRLAVSSVVRVFRFSPNTQLLKFKRSADRHGDVPDLSDSMTPDLEYLLVTMYTSPGNGLFEVTVKHSIPTDKYDVSEQGISRINRYGDDPRCIVDKFPNLRQFCYCV